MSAFMTPDELKDYLSAQKEAYNTSPLQALLELIREKRNNLTMVTIRPSGIVEFFDNSLFWAMKQVLGMRFGNSDATVIGSGVHAGADAGYQAVLRGEPIPDIRTCLMAVAEEVRKQYPYIESPDMTMFSIYKEAKRTFAVYYEQIMPKVTPIISEKRIEYVFNDVSGAPLGVKISGIPDRIARIDGKLVVRDLKTSSKGIGGKRVEVPEELLSYHERIKHYSARPKKSDALVALEEDLKLAKRRPKDSEELKALKVELKTQMRLIGRKTLPETENEDARIEAQKVDELIKELEMEKETHHEAQLIAAQLKVDDYIARRDAFRNGMLEQLQSYAQPLQEKLVQEQYTNDCEAAKRKHGLQLAAYALLAQIVLGEQIDTGVIELVVRYKDEPKAFNFEFDLSDMKLMLDEQLDIMLETIVAFKAGVDPKVLFRNNMETFRGSELTELIYKVRELNSEIVEAA